MLLKREGLPQESELLLCEVKKVHFHSVFVKIIEYGIEGMIHISEIAPGRIRNIRDFVKEGKFIVCKTLRVSTEKNQVDLSLRRVNDRERREKTNQVSQEQRAEKILEQLAKLLNMDVNEVYKLVTNALFKDYQYLYDAFMDVTEGKLDLTFDKKIAPKLKELIIEKIKPPVSYIKGHLKLVTYAPNGVELIRDAVAKVRKEVKGKFEVKYLGGGGYSLGVEAPDYGTCEDILKNVLENFQSNFSGQVEFEKA